MRLRGLFAVAALATVGAAPPERPVLRPEVPVMVGGYDDLDACMTNSQVTGLNPQGDNFLSLRSRPAVTAKELARLAPGQIVWACDESADGKWTGVVFGPPGAELDCGVGTPIATRQPYSGECTAGWVASRFLTPIAG